MGFVEWIHSCFTTLLKAPGFQWLFPIVHPKEKYMKESLAIYDNYDNYNKYDKSQVLKRFPKEHVKACLSVWWDTLYPPFTLKYNVWSSFGGEKYGYHQCRPWHVVSLTPHWPSIRK